MKTEIPNKLTRFTAAEVQALFKRAKKVYTAQGIDVRKAPASKTYSRLLVVIPKSTGSAPERNKIKRQLKAIFFEHQLYAKGFDILIIVHQQATELSFNTLQKILCNA